MGRPSLNLTRTHVGLSKSALARIDAIVGKKRRGSFVRKAVDQLLDAVELSQKLQAEVSSRKE